MAASAREGGTGHSLWPPGMTSVLELPWDLLIAIQHAYRILNWQENLMPDEMPPSWMWPLEWELEEWFEDVERRRKEKYGTDGGTDDVRMDKNEYAARFR